ncbi:MAG: gliding motility-associated C-terminal domain-containing protein, partial [Hymenobacteraceae bacterium]|nr:gliding motility-associated C-terminal domain-containing protein [Hymenobacteraceae bacterium]MDX5394766.1 gliding motility-associated C-terminal domain-containing protein [Hymenobacteraceae bacterium]MDX5510797.1 gliding motility-associated C-terminal domain-containing protein [Hymenobacteraceae bacterium]
MLIHIKHIALAGILLLLAVLGAPVRVLATHIRAGEITAKSDTTANPNPLRYFFKLVVYTDNSPGRPVNDSATLFFGDGTSQTSVFTFQQNLGNNTRVREYYFDHVYPGPNTYTVSYTEVNRNTGVRNISKSDQQSFFIQSQITIDPLLGINQSPVLRVPPIDVAARNQIWVHNPGAYDADGDSLSFVMRIPQRNAGTVQKPVPGDVPGYRDPADPSFGGTAVGGGPTTFTLDPFTGQIVWNTPNTLGEYNIAFAVEEWRKTPFGRRKIGEVVRDMQILVLNTVNTTPVLDIPLDLCVIANTTLSDTVTASDPDNHPIVLSAFSGIIPPATFNLLSSTMGIFSWTPTCEDVRNEPYTVVFKAQDIPPGTVQPLADLKTWRIKVIGPPPQGLTATPQARNIELNWNLYNCQNAEKILIYRREDSSNFVPDTCQTGVPAGLGYQKIGEVAANVTTFIDTNNGQGLDRGKTYCYLIYAQFPLPGGGESLASDEVCASLLNDVPFLTNVTVDETSDTNGQITVRWTQPIDQPVQLTPPFMYKLYRMEGQSGAGNAVQVFQSANLTDTVFVDTNLNTLDTAYSYKLEFYHSGIVGNPTILYETTPVASSVRLSGTPLKDMIQLNWTYNVPWNNSVFQHYIYRQINGTFTLIDSVAATEDSASYQDTGSFNNVPFEDGASYCFYVETRGRYSEPKIVSPLVNLSQQLCVTYVLEPCPPVLTFNQENCDNFTPKPSYQNELSWIPDRSGNCGQRIAYYKIYFSATAGGAFDSIGVTSDTTFIHGNLASQAGCYKITAVDIAGNESEFSNTVCKDNCIFFLLPNIITPNGDEYNEVFRPD